MNSTIDNCCENCNQLINQIRNLTDVPGTLFELFNGFEHYKICNFNWFKKNLTDDDIYAFKKRVQTSDLMIVPMNLIRIHRLYEILSIFDFEITQELFDKILAQGLSKQYRRFVLKNSSMLKMEQIIKILNSNISNSKFMIDYVLVDENIREKITLDDLIYILNNTKNFCKYNRIKKYVEDELTSAKRNFENMKFEDFMRLFDNIHISHFSYLTFGNQFYKSFIEFANNLSDEQINQIHEDDSIIVSSIKRFIDVVCYRLFHGIYGLVRCLVSDNITNRKILMMIINHIQLLFKIEKCMILDILNAHVDILLPNDLYCVHKYLYYMDKRDLISFFSIAKKVNNISITTFIHDIISNSRTKHELYCLVDEFQHFLTIDNFIDMVPHLSYNGSSYENDYLLNEISKKIDENTIFYFLQKIKSEKSFMYFAKKFFSLLTFEQLLALCNENMWTWTDYYYLTKKYHSKDKLQKETCFHIFEKSPKYIRPIFSFREKNYMLKIIKFYCEVFENNDYYYLLKKYIESCQPNMIGNPTMSYISTKYSPSYDQLVDILDVSNYWIKLELIDVYKNLILGYNNKFLIIRHLFSIPKLDRVSDRKKMIDLIVYLIQYYTPTNEELIDLLSTSDDFMVKNHLINNYASIVSQIPELFNFDYYNYLHDNIHTICYTWTTLYLCASNDHHKIFINDYPSMIMSKKNCSCHCLNLARIYRKFVEKSLWKEIFSGIVAGDINILDSLPYYFN
jgi:hypothetical protein